MPGWSHPQIDKKIACIEFFDAKTCKSLVKDEALAIADTIVSKLPAAASPPSLPLLSLWPITANEADPPAVASESANA